MSKNLEQLSVLRKDWVEANRKNGFEDGITNLLTQLYPDNAHFIYELLQNAEDPCATEVEFRVTRNSVEFEHNGKRLFDIDDVDSITSIGKSTKKDDPTSIGKFGVGFKAVFAYTNTPEINSGDLNFRIRDLVVPEMCNIKSRKTLYKTRFILPFDNPSKEADKAVYEIERSLRSLGDNTLLFLKNIRAIKYELHDGATGSLERIDHTDGRTEIIISNPDGKVISSDWLILNKDVSIFDEDNQEKKCRIAIAYALEKNSIKNNEEAKAEAWKVKPVKRGQVSIFFPADKETSNLKFHIHAPFASTVARDSIRDCGANNLLRDSIASLVVESLHEIRDKGMLSVDFFKVLPNTRDNLPDFYEPIRQEIVNAFKTQSLTPTRIGGHAPASTLHRGPAKISSVLNDDDIIAITKYNKPFWVANPQQRNQREDQFIDTLDITRWDWSDLALVFNEFEEECQSQSIYELVRKKDDRWVQRLYSLLGEMSYEHGEFFYLSDCRIVRVDKNDKIDHVCPSNAFFPSESSAESDLPENSYFVRKESYFSKSINEYAISFLKTLGVKEFNARTIISLDLESLESNRPRIDDDSYYERIKRYIKYWKEHPDESDLFESCDFLIGSKKHGNLKWVEANNIALGSSYEDTGLDSNIEGHSKYILWDGYIEKFTASQLKDFISFAKSIGVMHGLEIVNSRIYLNPNKSQLYKDSSARETYTGINEDYTIEGLLNYLKNPSIALSRMIWKCIISAQSKCAKARYRPNQKYLIRETDSYLVYHLRINAWIPDQDGNFKKPEDISRIELRKDFVYDDNNGLLTAIGFEGQEKKRNLEYHLKDKAAKAAGFDSVEEQEKFIKIKEICKEKGISPDEVFSQYLSDSSDLTEYELPERSQGKSGIRQKRLAEEAVNAPERISEKRSRTVQINKAFVKEEARIYLEENYTNYDESMSCQICKAELPFKQRDGSYYFEAVEFFSDAKRFYPQNYLSLCPNHAAMFRLVNDSESSLVSELVNLVDEVELPIVLAGEEHSIYFTERHREDLKTILAIDDCDKGGQVSSDNGQLTERAEKFPFYETVSGYESINFPTGLDNWKKGYLYESNGKWILATPAGKIVASFPDKINAQQWWDKFSAHRGLVPTPSLRNKRPKPKQNGPKKDHNVVPLERQSLVNEQGTCPRCNGSGGYNGGCQKCDGTGWLS